MRVVKYVSLFFCNLQGLFKLKVLEPFNHQVNPEGHADTKFHHWLRCNKPACSSYKVNAKSPKFEPWGIVDRELALRHPYDEVYRGYGKCMVANTDSFKQLVEQR